MASVLCEKCGQPIETVEDAWVEWYRDDDRYEGPRIVHQGDRGHTCQARRTGVMGHHLVAFLDTYRTLNAGHLDSMRIDYGINPLPIVNALLAFNPDLTGAEHWRGELASKTERTS